MNTCVGTIGPLGYAGSMVHVSASPAITGISPASFPANVPTPVAITGTNFGLSGMVEFTGAGLQSFSVPYNTASTQSINVTATLASVGTYNVDVKETTDPSHFTFSLAGAVGQAPVSAPSQQSTVTTTGAPVKLVLTSSVNQFNSPSTPLSQVDPSVRLPIGLNCAMINGTPVMPQITAQVVDRNTGSPVTSRTAQFNLHLQFNQMTAPVGSAVQTSVAVPYAWDLVPSGPCSRFLPAARGRFSPRESWAETQR